MKCIFMTIIILAAGSRVNGDACQDLAPTWCATRKSECHDNETVKRFCRKTCGICTPATPLPKGKTYPPYKGKCGRPEIRGPRIVAGTTATRGSWPWQILLIYRGFGNCGGTLISPEWVVSAAHCVYRRESIPSAFDVRVGDFNTRIDEGTEDQVTVEKIFRHPDYSTHTLNNDISLLKLSRPVQLTKYIQPACLPSANPPVGSKCYVSGWGQTKHPGDMATMLQQAPLPVISNKQCNAKNYPAIHIPITPAMICGAGGPRVSACHGDSGGPYVCHIDGRWELHGSVSHGSGACVASKAYSVFSRTYHFKEWIQRTMAHE